MRPSPATTCYLLVLLAVLAAFGVLAALGTVPAEPGDASPEAIGGAREGGPLPARGRAATPPSQRIERAVRVAGWYSAPVGRSIRWRLDARTETDLGGVRQPDVRLVGEMRVRVEDRGAGEILAAVSLPAPESASASAPFLVRIDPSGTILGYRFRDGTTLSERNLARGVLSQLLMTVPVDATTAWSSIGSDATGRFEASHVVTRARGGGSANQRQLAVRRQKLRYLEPMPEAGAGLRIVSSSLDATFDRELGWLSGARVDETLELELGPGAVTIRSRFVGLLTSIGWCDDAAGRHEEDGWSGVQVAAGGHEDCGRDHNRSATEREWSQRLRGRSAAELIDELARVIGTDPVRSLARCEKIAWLARLDPRAVTAVRNRVLDADQELAGALLAALGKAGTEPAQRALLDLYTGAGANADDGTRLAAVDAMFAIAAPTPGLLEDLGRQVAAAATIDVLQSSAFLLLGALAGRDDRVDGNAVDRLITLESRAVQLHAVDVWLEAVANSGSARAAQRAAAYLAAAEPGVRAAACLALGSDPSPAATRALVSRAADDVEASVRMAAAGALAGRGPDALAVLSSVLTDDPELEVRRAALLACADRARVDGPIRRAIETVAAFDTSPALRELARRIL